jgi:hypothetical protein
MSDIPERKPIISERKPGRTFDVYMAPQVDQMYTDGISRIFLGPQVTKIELFHTIGQKQEDGSSDLVEERETFCRLTVPTVGLIEACGILIEQMGANMSVFDASHQQLKEVIANAIQKAAAVKA